MTVLWHNIIPKIEVWLYNRLRLKHTYRWTPLTPEQIERLKLIMYEHPALVEQILFADIMETEKIYDDEK